MKIAITGAAGRIGRALTTRLTPNHEVFPTDLVAADSNAPIVQADVLNRGAMDALCGGMDAVIHLASSSWQDNLSNPENATCILDTRLKGTYNVLHAAMNAGVQRVIQISDLCLFSGYDHHLIVSEDFIPLPDTSAYQQSVYLSELVGREFARLSPGLVLTLRLGRIVDSTGLSTDVALDYEWLDIRDAVEAIVRGLEIKHYDGLGHWGLYNLAADIPGSRYTLLKIMSGHYGFRPVHNFETWWKESGV